MTDTNDTPKPDRGDFTNRELILLHAGRHMERIAFLFGGLNDEDIRRRVRINEASAYGPSPYKKEKNETIDSLKSIAIEHAERQAATAAEDKT